MNSLFETMLIFRPVQNRYIIDIPCEVIEDENEKSFDVEAAYKKVAELITDAIFMCDANEVTVPIDVKIGDYCLIGKVEVSLTFKYWENDSYGGYRDCGHDISKISVTDIDLTVYDEDADEVSQSFDIKQIQKYL